MTLERSVIRAAALAFALAAAQPLDAQTNTSPKADDVEETALFRAEESWTVTTTLFLSASDPDGNGPWTFRILNPQALVDVNGAARLTCTYPTPGGGQATTKSPAEAMVTNGNRIECRYHPPVRVDGTDTFQYTVTDTVGGKPGATSPPGTVTIDVKPQGLRWEVITSAGQAMSGNSLQSAANTIPDVIGKATQDFVLGLDWLFRSPQYAPLDEDDLGSSTWAGHFAFRTGLVSQPQAVEATPVAAATGEPAPGAAAEPAVVTQRKFTVGGEFNYNWVLPESPVGAFLEIGALARGNLDAAVERDDDYEQIAGRVLRLVRSGEGAGSFRGEAGIRVVLKQYDTTTTGQTRQRGPDADTEYARNADDFLTVEAGYQRDTALAGDPALRDRQNRYFIRVLATPVAVPGVPGHGKPLIGMEVAWSKDQPKQFKVLYGANLSAVGAALGLGR